MIGFAGRSMWKNRKKDTRHDTQTQTHTHTVYVSSPASPQSCCPLNAQGCYPRVGVCATRHLADTELRPHTTHSPT